MYIKKILLSVVGIIVLIFLVPCINIIKPGEVGVIINLIGSERGIQNKELTVGFHFVPPWRQLYRFPTYEQNHEWVDEDGFVFQTSEGLSVKADIGITFNLVQSQIHELFYKYRRGMKEITHLFIRNNIRDAINRYASKLKIEDLYGPKKEDFFDDVTQHIRNELKDLGFNISRLYIIGKFVVPDTVMDALNKKIEAIQRAQQRENELREAEAEAKKIMAKADGEAGSRLIAAKVDAESLIIHSKATAESNRRIADSLTENLIKWQQINQWDGALPKLCGDKVPFMINLENTK